MSDWIVTAGSLVVVLVMVGVAAALGFRKSAVLDEARVNELAAGEGAAVEHTLIAPDGRAALAQLNGGKLMIARVMGNDVSARTAPTPTARVRYASGRLSVAFADLGYPPLNMKLDEAPPWIAALAAGDA